MLKRSLAAGALAVTLAAPAAHAKSASTPGHPSGRSPVRLWYRISAFADLTKAGDFAWPAYTDHRAVHIKLRVRATGAETLVPSLVGGFRGAAFDPTPTYDGPPLPSIVRFRSAGRFGRSFTIESRESVQEPLTNGTWITSGPVELRFDLCDRGGRRPGGC